jgi:hypothetical protein
MHRPGSSLGSRNAPINVGGNNGPRPDFNIYTRPRPNQAAEAKKEAREKFKMDKLSQRRKGSPTKKNRGDLVGASRTAQEDGRAQRIATLLKLKGTGYLSKEHEAQRMASKGAMDPLEQFKLDDWIQGYKGEAQGSKSVALECQLLLQQANIESRTREAPDKLAVSVALDCFDRLCGVFSRYEGVMGVLRPALLEAIFTDPESVPRDMVVGAAPGGRAEHRPQRFHRCATYFERCREMLRERKVRGTLTAL